VGPVLRNNSIRIALDANPPSRDNSQGPLPMLQRGTLAMTRFTPLLHTVRHLAGTLLMLLVDVVRFLSLCLRPSAVLAAENLFLRKQLALYQERHVKPRRATDAARLALVWLGRWFDWRRALAVVQPATFLHWHRQGFRLFWRWQSRL